MLYKHKELQGNTRKRGRKEGSTMMWKDSYRLGVEQIDQQHRELFDMTEELVNAVEEGATAADYEKAVGFLQDYVIEHFRDEEAYLASLHARDLAAHQAEHQAFTETVENYGRRLKENGFDEKTMKDLAGTVTAWLIYHVVDTDQKSVTGAVQEEGRFRQCVELFAHSALEVLEAMAGVSPEVPIQESQSYVPQGDIFVRIGLVGQVSGAAIFGFSEELALRLVEAMTMMTLDQVDELVESALCEVTNIACGNGATALVKRGLPCDIRPPVLSRSVDSQENGIGVVLDTAAGRLQVGLFLEDAAQQDLP